MTQNVEPVVKQKKKGGCLKTVGFVILGLIVLGVIIGMLGGEDSTDTSTNDSKETQTETSAPAPTPDKEEKVNAIGDVVKVGTAVFTINSVELLDQVGPTALPETASGKYVVLDVTYKNEGNEAVMFDASFFKLKNGEKTYESDSMASMSANQGEDGSIQESFFFQEVNPDSEVTGKVVFDVNPDVAESADLMVQVQTGLFGTETDTIKLK